MPNSNIWIDQFYEEESRTEYFSASFLLNTCSLTWHDKKFEVGGTRYGTCWSARDAANPCTMTIELKLLKPN